uniref:Ciliary associated calcium binding coiled-coil 1 n=1 Tax=Crocodylus porosus TaxID=8502 RepID=A0A7M4ET36_CROPO
MISYPQLHWNCIAKDLTGSLKLEEFLNFKQLKTSLKEAVILDYYLLGFWWAKEMNFNLTQLSGFMALLNFLLENLSTKHMTLEDNIKELGRTMVGIGEPRSGNSGDLDFFSVDQAKAVISYLKISLLQHYKLYEYLFHSPREELVIGDECRLKGNLVAAYKFIRGAHQRLGECLFTRALQGMTRLSGHKLLHDCFRLDIRKNFSTPRSGIDCCRRWFKHLL